MERIKAESCLGVAQPGAGLHGKPEVAERIGKFAAGRAFHGFEVSTFTNYNGAWVGYRGLHHRGYVLREVLAVGIERYGVGKSVGHCAAEAGFQCCSLAGVAGQGHHGNAFNRGQNRRRFVGGIVICNFRECSDNF